MGENIHASIESLLNMEKQARLASDVAGTKDAVTSIIQLRFEARAWKTLNDQIVLLSKRRGQLKQELSILFDKSRMLPWANKDECTAVCASIL